MNLADPFHAALHLIKQHGLDAQKVADRMAGHAERLGDMKLARQWWSVLDVLMEWKAARPLDGDAVH